MYLSKMHLLLETTYSVTNITSYLHVCLRLIKATRIGNWPVAYYGSRN